MLLPAGKRSFPIISLLPVTLDSVIILQIAFMKISCLAIEHKTGNNLQVLYPTLLQNGRVSYLVDCGYAENFTAIVARLESLGTGISNLGAILLTHDDIDHLGGVWQFKQANPAIKLLCSRQEALSVSGKVKSERLKQAEDSLPFLPEEYKKWAMDFIEDLMAIKRVEPDATFEDGDWLGEIQVVHTPGHTSGHVSFYLPAQKTLIAGDAVVIESGKLNIANPQFTLDMATALQSVKKLAELPVEKLICYHGGLLEGDISAALLALLEEYEAKG